MPGANEPGIMEVVLQGNLPTADRRLPSSVTDVGNWDGGWMGRDRGGKFELGTKERLCCLVEMVSKRIHAEEVRLRKCSAADVEQWGVDS